MNPGVARLGALAAAVLFSTGGAAIKVAAFSAAQVSAFRSGIAAIVLLAWFNRRLTWTRWTFVAGVVYSATLTLFVGATKLTTAANAIFLQSTAPLYILLLGPWVLRERVHRRDVISLVGIAIGMVFCFLGQTNATSTAPDPVTGNWLAVGSGVAWAMTLVALRHLNREATTGREGAGLAAVVAGNTIASLLAMPWALPLPEATMGEWATLVYLGVVQVALAYVCLTAAMRRLPALDVALLLLLEPVLNPLWAWLVRGEHPGGWTLAGGAVILAFTAVRTVSSARAAE